MAEGSAAAERRDLSRLMRETAAARPGRVEDLPSLMAEAAARRQRMEELDSLIDEAADRRERVELRIRLTFRQILASPEDSPRYISATSAWDETTPDDAAQALEDAVAAEDRAVYKIVHMAAHEAPDIEAMVAILMPLVEHHNPETRVFLEVLMRMLASDEDGVADELGINTEAFIVLKEAYIKAKYN